MIPLKTTLATLEESDAKLVNHLRDYYPIGSNYSLDIKIDAGKIHSVRAKPHPQYWQESRENLQIHCMATNLDQDSQVLVTPEFWNLLKRKIAS